MREPTITELLKLYEEGKATDEQRRQVEAFLAWHRRQGPRKPQTGADDGSLDEIMEQIRLVREAGRLVSERAEAPVYPMEEAAPWNEERSVGRRRYTWIAAAGIAVIVAMGLLWRQSQPKPVPVQIATVYKTIQARPGETIHLLLSDSSEVWLNAGAKLKYPQPFGDSMRRVELLDGEAFFQIRHEAKRGFEVAADRLTTRVLGTSFNIKAYHGAQQVSVTVITGKVGVRATRTTRTTRTDRPEQELLLTANQQARYSESTGSLVRSSEDRAGRTVGWKNGDFGFSEEPFGDIAVELEHHFDVHIDFKYPGLRKYLVSASFRPGTTVKDMLTTLCLLNQNHLTQTDAQHYVIH